jgi:hypothetical protein
VGVYIFRREPFDIEMKWIEPNGDSYILAWLEAESLMKLLLEMEEEFLRRVTDMLWNFYTVGVVLDTERVVALRQTDRDGWEDEVALAFHDEEQESNLGGCPLPGDKAKG